MSNNRYIGDFESAEWNSIRVQSAAEILDVKNNTNKEESIERSGRVTESDKIEKSNCTILLVGYKGYGKTTVLTSIMHSIESEMKSVGRVTSPTESKVRKMYVNNNIRFSLDLFPLDTDAGKTYSLYLRFGKILNSDNGSVLRIIDVAGEDYIETSTQEFSNLKPHISNSVKNSDVIIPIFLIPVDANEKRIFKEGQTSTWARIDQSYKFLIQKIMIECRKETEKVNPVLLVGSYDKFRSDINQKTSKEQSRNFLSAKCKKTYRICIDNDIPIRPFSIGKVSYTKLKESDLVPKRYSDYENELRSGVNMFPNSTSLSPQIEAKNIINFCNTKKDEQQPTKTIYEKATTILNKIGSIVTDLD